MKPKYTPAEILEKTKNRLIQKRMYYEEQINEFRIRFDELGAVLDGINYLETEKLDD